MRINSTFLSMNPIIQLYDSEENPGWNHCSSKHIQKAVSLLIKYFGDSVDKTGMPKILHSMSVGLSGKSDDETVVGFLHDLLEDTSCQESELLEYFPKRIVESVKVLTRKPDEKYNEYIHRIKESGNTLAVQVKLYDLDYNLLRSVASDSFSLKCRYEKAKRILTES